MNIVVCIKQVPDTTKVDIDEKTGVLKRAGTESKLNPFDLYALETALRLKEKYGGIVGVITMGPPGAAEIIKEAYATGADHGTLLTDAAFAGSDTLATGYALSQGIRRLGTFDLIICGKQTTDGDTAQTGPGVAEFLDIPHVVNATEVIDIANGAITLKTDMQDYIYTLSAPLPCLISVEKSVCVPRLPSYKKMTGTADRRISVLTLRDMYDTDPDNYGLTGSPTAVRGVFSPETKAGTVRIDGSGEEIAGFLYEKLKALKFI